jgi:hypothetical protein
VTCHEGAQYLCRKQTLLHNLYYERNTIATPPR